MHAISMRDLRKMSAGAIQALPHAVPIKNGATTVGVLLPVRTPESQNHLRKVLDDIEADAASRSPEQNRAIDELLAERGID